MYLRSGCTANKEGQTYISSFHLSSHMDHLLERGSDKSAKPDHIGFFVYCSINYFVSRHHNAEVDNLVVVTGKHNTNNVLSDVVHITLDCCKEDFTGALLLFPFTFKFDIGRKNGDCLFHHPGALHHLGKEHLTRSEKIANLIHTVHQGSFYYID